MHCNVSMIFILDDHYYILLHHQKITDAEYYGSLFLIDDLHESVGYDTLVQLVAPVDILLELVVQLAVGLLPLQDEVVQIMIPKLLPGPALPGALPRLLQLQLGVRLLPAGPLPPAVSVSGARAAPLGLGAAGLLEEIKKL